MHPLVIRADRHSIRGGKHGKSHVRTGKTNRSGNRLVIIHHQSRRHRLPIIRHQHHRGFIPHDLLRLLRQLLQHRRIRSREHQLYRVFLVHQVIPLHPHVSVRIIRREIILYLLHRFFQRLRGRVIHDQLPITHRRFGNRPYQIVAGRSTPYPRRHVCHLGAVHQIVLDLRQIGFHPLHSRALRHLEFYI